MTNLKLYLFGYPRIEVASEADSAELARRQKACAIAYYLIVEKQTFARSRLAELFWANLSTKDALSYLRGRSGLHTLSKKLDTHFDIARSTATFDDTEPFWCDAFEFERLTSKHKPTIDELEQAIGLYQGDFLVGLELNGVSAEFDDWVASYRQKYSQLMIDTLDRAVAYHTTWQEFEAGLAHATRLLAHEPWREETHRQLMRLYAFNDQRSAALAQYDACCDTLEAELGVSPSDETTNLFFAIRDDKLAQPMPIPFLPPAQVNHFVGRQALLNQLDAAIEQQGNKNILALVGMGGIGKTTTAIHLAHRLRRGYEDGVLWANTAESDSAEILTSWALMYDVDLKHLPSLEARQTAWRGITEGKRILLVLDNVESEGEVRPILPNSPHCTVIITTRNHDVAHALNAHLIDLPTLEQQSAFGLLEKIVGEERVSAEAEAASSICEQLEYLPLALEIVAQRLSSRPRYRLTTFAEQLVETASRLDPLTMGDRAVRASFELSWQMLSPELQRVFAGLAVFEGSSFSAEAMAYILEKGELEMVDGLEDLLALSLVSSAENERYRQHALLADFSAEKVSGTVFATDLESRYVYCYLHKTKCTSAVNELDFEWKNMLRAHVHAHQAQMWSSLWQLAEQMRPHWTNSARFSEARKAYKLASDAAYRLESTEKLALINYEWAAACVEQGDFQTARPLIEQATQLYSSLADNHGKGRTHLLSCKISLETEDYNKANKEIKAAIVSFDAVGDLAGLGQAHYRLGNIASRNYQVVEASNHYDRALKLCQQANDDISVLSIQNWRANVALEQGNINAAQKIMEQAQALNDRLCHKPEEAVMLFTMVRICRARKEYSTALQHASSNLALARSMGDCYGEADILNLMALVEWDFHQSEPTRNCLLQAVEWATSSYFICERLQALNRAAIAKLTTGRLYMLQNNRHAAKEQWQHALTIALETENDGLVDYIRHITKEAG